MLKNKKLNLKFHLLDLVTSFFYLGKIPKMPGTFGSLGAIPLIYFLKTFPYYFYYLGFFLILFIIAFFSIKALEKIRKQHDHQQIVIDEVLGMMVACSWIPNTIFYLSLAFVFFRFFDIFKPFPISWIDQKIKGSFGVLLDDFLAGIFALVILKVLENLI